jgi:hypothetical protein
LFELERHADQARHRVGELLGEICLALAEGGRGGGKREGSDECEAASHRRSPGILAPRCWHRNGRGRNPGAQIHSIL